MRNFFKAAQRKHHFQHSLRIEPLETRNLLTATLTGTEQGAGGTLQVLDLSVGTATPSTISIGGAIQSLDSIVGTATPATISIGGTIHGGGGQLELPNPPSGTDKTVNVNWPTYYAFKATDFGFTDPQGNDEFTGVVITTLPTSGELVITGTPFEPSTRAAVQAGQFISVEDIAAGKLWYLPALDILHPTMTFQVKDNGSNSAYNLDPTPNTITFNTAPVAQDDAYTVNESETLDQRMIVSNLHMVSQPGDPVGKGLTYDFSDLTYDFSVTRDQNNGIHIMLGRPVPTQPGDIQMYELGPQLYFTAANGGVLTPGTYSDVVRPNSQILDKPSMWVSPNFGLGVIIGSFTGQFTVNAVEYGTSGEVLSLDITFEQHVGPLGGLISPDPVYNVAALTGRILYHAANSQSVSILQDDHDFEGDPLTAVLVAGPQHGTLTLNDDGGFVYTPTPGFNGIDTFQYKANDGAADSNISTVTIEVVPFSHAPVGTSRIIGLPESDSYTLKIADFGFTDPGDTPADAFTRVQFTMLPTSGVLTLDGVPVNTGDFISADDIAAGKLVITFDPSVPHPNCMFQVEDSGSTENGGGNFDLVPKTLAFDFLPTPQDDSYSVDENSTLVVDSSLSVLLNDSDPDADSLIASIFTNPTHGTVQLQSDGTFIYTPDPYFSGVDTFQYQSNDGLVLGSIATVTITVNNISQAPVGTSGTVNVPAGEPYAIKAEDFGFTDPHDTPADQFAGVLITTLPTRGSMTLDKEPVVAGQFVSAADLAEGKLTFMPPAYGTGSGRASFTFQVQDSGSTDNGGAILDAEPKTLILNSTPVAFKDTYRIENAEKVLYVLANDRDADEDFFYPQIFVNPSHGTLFFNYNSFVYYPNADFYGTDTFQYRINDGSADSNVATVTINVVRPITVKIEPITELTAITTSSPLHFLAHFSEPVVDFTADDLTIGGTAPGTLKATINPRPTNGSTIYYYDVWVSGMTGSGTVTVSLAADTVHTADGISNAAASSADHPIDYLANGVTISGTKGDDIFVFQAGDTPATWKLTVNGQTRVIPADISSLLIDGVSGSDTLSFSGSGEALTAALGYEQGKIYFRNYTFAYLNMDHTNVVGQSGHDVATLQDSAGNDSFESLPDSAKLSTAGKSLTLKNIAAVTVQGTTGDDTAVLYGSLSADNIFVADANGAGFFYNESASQVNGFNTVSAYAGPGRNNIADFRDTDGHNLLIASYLGAQYFGQGFAYDVWNLSRINGLGGDGDEARFYGSPVADTALSVSPTAATQTEPNLTLQGIGYSKFSSYVYPGGNTSAYIVGSIGDDRAVTSLWGAQLFGANYELSAWTYKNINLIGNEGHDVVQMYGLDGAAKFEGHGTSASFASGNVTRSVDRFSEIYAHGNAASTATFFAQPGMKNTFDASPTQASMSSAGNPALAEQTHGLGNMQDAKYGAAYKITALDFGSNTAYANAGGTDEANYADSPGADYFISSYLGSQMFGQGYNNSAWNFAAMTAASTGGADTARFYGSPSNPDSFVANPTNAKHSGTGYQSEAKNFARVEAYSGLGSGGTAQLTGTSGDDQYVGSPLGAQLWNHNYRVEAWNYASVKTEGAGGNDNANLYGKASNNRLVADNVFAQFSGDGFANRIEHFAKACVYGSTTGSDSAELDHAFFNSGWKDQPNDITELNIVRKLWISDFDEVAVTRKPDDPTPHPQAIDKLMTAFMYE